MKKVLNGNFKAGSRESNEPRRMSEVLDEFFQSNEPMAVGYRARLFKDIHPHTELGVNLKLMTRGHGRMPEGTCLVGTILHDGENHFTFMEEAPERKGRKSSRCVFKGHSVNVHRKDDGTLFPTFRQPHYTRFYTFLDFCREAADELLAVAGLIEEKE